MTTGPIVTNADRDWAIKQCPEWMCKTINADDEALPELVDDGGWLDIQPDDGAQEAPSAFNYVLEQIENFERFYAGQQKTYAQWSYFWRKKWWPTAFVNSDPSRRFPKSAPRVSHPFWYRGTEEYDRALQVGSQGERMVWERFGIAQVNKDDERVSFIKGGGA